MIARSNANAPGELLLDPPAFLQTAKVFDMLLALPRVGRVKAAKIMNSAESRPARPPKRLPA